MKTRNYALMLFAGVALLVTSCVNEREISVAQIGKDEIAFRLGRVQTKASAEDFFIPIPEKVASFRASNGENYAIEETVTLLDGAPETKGTPAFTENVSSLYGAFSAIAFKDGGDKLDDAEFPFNEGTGFWSHYYWGGIWDEAPFTFYMRMPSAPAGVTSAYTYDNTTNKSIKFSYTSPEKAVDQEDILFSSATMANVRENGKTVTFYHALTGIKFANFYTNSGIPGAEAVTKTIIKEVTLAGVKNTGTCEMIFDGVNEETRSWDVANWTGVSGSATFTLSNLSDTTNYSGGQYGLDTLLNSTAKARNLNDEDGSLTFWIVPQSLDSTVMITMKCDLELVEGDKTTKTVSDTTITVSLGKRDWKAGELHTFTLKPVIVGVELTDNMTDYEKSTVRVENTGNVYEYVRVNMIGNWVGEVQTAAGVYDDNEVILMGYKTSSPSDMTEVEFWNDKDNDIRGYYLDKNKQKIDPLYTVNGENYLMYGEFTNLTPRSFQVPADPDSVYNHWARYDKYYYYTKPIGPNDAITEQIFESYVVGPSPEFWIVDKSGVRRKARNVHLVLDLMVQAIPAPVDENGNVLDNDDDEGYIRAWLEALDFEPTEANYKKLLDL